MIDMADFATLKEKITIVQALEMLGVMQQLNREGKGFRGPCPICKEGGNRSFQVYPETNSYYCWSERKGGSIIDLVARRNRVDEATAGRQLASHFKMDSPRQPADNGSGGAKFNAEEFAKHLDPAHEALRGLGISAETLRAVGGGYCTRPSLRGRLALPIRDENGTMTGFFGIALDGQEPELLFPKGTEPPELFNCQAVQAGTLHVVFHPVDALRAIDSGMDEQRNTIAVLSPLTPALLMTIGTLAQKSGVDIVEFH
jgi:DNA primase